MNFVFSIVKILLPRKILAVFIKLKGVKSIDLSFVNKIREKELDYLSDPVKLEQELLPELGFNDELLYEFPAELHKNCGHGLFHWQYPNQFSKYLVLLSKLNIESYLEIGVRHGGTFVITVEYLERFYPIKTAIGIDICKCTSLINYKKMNPKVEFMQTDSASIEFKEYVQKQNEIDLVFIDGNHDEEMCRNDYETVRSKANILVFHDIVSDACPGVKKVWSEIKNQHAREYRFIEYGDQYESVGQKTGKSFFGIGLAVRNEYFKRKNIQASTFANTGNFFPAK